MGVGYFCVLYGWMDAGWLSSKRWHAYPDLYFLVYVKKSMSSCHLENF